MAATVSPAAAASTASGFGVSSTIDPETIINIYRNYYDNFYPPSSPFNDSLMIDFNDLEAIG
ncbi:hypothetical protein QR98_0050450 [Sarcoptes scabiei]|uniref:Uncharacterized protein n=1 Tax=Sarcoptes scabiei TaxID=52283 RepID=A0A132A6G8_SARSC|nr:hypothetical protein QR98_0050450 [Sarcoptes scabiei]